jgi:serine/threonine protein kinase
MVEPFSVGGSVKGTPVVPGRVVAGKYRLVRLLGSGGMGTVHVAEHVQVMRSFALKFLRPDRSSTPRYLRRFEREAELLGRLEHENVVSLLDIGVDDTEGPYLVLEYVRGVTLRQELDRHGIRPPERLHAIVEQMARGLTHAHELGIVHRDLKPENVMLASHADGGLLVKLLDFGVAGLRSEVTERMTLSDMAIGTAGYMAPEQARGDRGFDARTDVYALGVITYEALSGVRPYTGDSYNETLFKILHRKHRPLSELRPELPASVVRAVERALSKEPDARFDSAAEFVRELSADLPQRVLPATRLDSSEQTLEAEAPAFPTKPDRIPRARPFVLLGLGLALGYGVAFVTPPRSKNEEQVAATASVVAPPPAPAPPVEPAARPALAPVAQGADAQRASAPDQGTQAAGSPPSPKPRAQVSPSARPGPLRAVPPPRATEPAALPKAPAAANGYILNNPYPNVVGLEE